MRSFIRFFSYLIIISSVAISASWLLFQNIYFHTDIARDFLILEDMYYGRHISLLGPRAGGMEGIFHGPLWFYINLPAFIIGRGNPVVVGWFWVVLYLAVIMSVFIVCRKMFNSETAYIAAALVAVQGINVTKMLLNPYGAVLVSPFIFYFFYRYVNYQKVADLLWFVFLTGIAIQFEMAFGIPILLMGIAYTMVNVFKVRKPLHIFAYAILLIPLSTFVLFDIRHQFLQTHAFLSYIIDHKDGTGYTLSILCSRILHLLDVANMVAAQQPLLSLIVTGLTLYMLFIDRKRTGKLKDSVWLFAYFYIGFALISFFLFKGDIQSYYTEPFLPIFALVFVSCALKMFYKPAIYLLILTILIFGLTKGVQETMMTARNSVRDGSTWQFNRRMAESIYSKNRNRPFGYYIYTPDLLGYGPRYAMNYVQRKAGRQDIYPYQKKDITYLIMSPAPFHSALGSTDWKKNEVKIHKHPVSKTDYSNGYIVEMYTLTKEEQRIQSNPNMIQSVIMR